MQIKDPLIFIAGSIIGAGITFLTTRKILNDKAEAKYEALYQKDKQSLIDSIAEYREKDKKRAEAAREKPPLTLYVDAINKANEREAARVNYSSISTGNAKEEEEIEDDAEAPLIDSTLIDEDTDTSGPYVMKRWPNPSESEYTQLEVTYYSDGTYADTRDTEMEIEDYIGKKMMDYVANTDKDEIFIRNDELGLDIDITKDSRTYDEVMFG
jgi:hypothetical protein